MSKQAVLVKDDFLVTSYSQKFYEGVDIVLECSAVLNVLIRARQEEVEGGILFIEGNPNATDAAAIIFAKIGEVVTNEEPQTSEEMCAVEALKSANIKVAVNPKILL